MPGLKEGPGRGNLRHAAQPAGQCTLIEFCLRSSSHLWSGTSGTNVLHVGVHCGAAAGIGPNLLLARLATRRAKPNGQYRILQTQSQQFLGDLSVDSLPGVGWSLAAKLAELGIQQVAAAHAHIMKPFISIIGIRV